MIHIPFWGETYQEYKAFSSTDAWIGAGLRSFSPIFSARYPATNALLYSSRQPLTLSSDIGYTFVKNNIDPNYIRCSVNGSGLITSTYTSIRGINGGTGQATSLISSGAGSGSPFIVEAVEPSLTLRFTQDGANNAIPFALNINYGTGVPVIATINRTNDTSTFDIAISVDPNICMYLTTNVSFNTITYPSHRVGFQVQLLKP